MRKRDRRIAEEELKALDDARVVMVQKHEKPLVIQAVSAAYLQLYGQIQETETGQRRRENTGAVF